MYYQLVTRYGVPFGYPVYSGDILLRRIPPSVRPIMAKLGFRIVVVRSIGNKEYP